MILYNNQVYDLGIDSNIIPESGPLTTIDFLRLRNRKEAGGNFDEQVQRCDRFIEIINTTEEMNEINDR